MRLRGPLPAAVERAALVAYAAAVLVASVATPPPGDLSPSGPLGVGVDKWLHAGAYGGMALLAAVVLDGRTRRTVALAVALAVGFGAGVEVVQAFLPARAFDLVDAAANAVGAAVGSAVWVAVRRAGTDDRPTAE